MEIIKCADCGFGYVGAAGESACPKCAVAQAKESAPTQSSPTNVAPSTTGSDAHKTEPETRSTRRVSQGQSVEELDSIIRRLDLRTAEIEKSLARLAGGIRLAQPAMSYLAVAALVAAFVMPIAAIILGHLAQREIRESNGYKYGDGMATAGLILGYLGVVGIVFWIFAAVTAASQGY